METKKILVAASYDFDDFDRVEPAMAKAIADHRLSTYAIEIVTFKHSSDKAHVFNAEMDKLAARLGFSRSEIDIPSRAPESHFSANAHAAEYSDAAILFDNQSDTYLNDLQKKLYAASIRPLIYPYEPKPIVKKNKKKLKPLNPKPSIKEKAKAGQTSTTKNVTPSVSSDEKKTAKTGTTRYSFTEYKKKVDICDVILHAGYLPYVHSRASMSASDLIERRTWLDFHLVEENEGRNTHVPGSTVRVNTTKNYFSKGMVDKPMDYYDFIAQNVERFPEELSKIGPYPQDFLSDPRKPDYKTLLSRLVNRVCQYVLEHPRESAEVRAVRIADRIANEAPFNITKYPPAFDMQPGEDPYSKRIEALDKYLGYRHIDKEVQKAFSPFMYVARHVERGRSFDNLAFKMFDMSHPDAPVVGLNLRGTAEAPINLNAPGSKHSVGVWLGTPMVEGQESLRSKLEKAEVVVWTEAPIDCMSYYQIKKTEIERRIAKLEEMSNEYGFAFTDTALNAAKASLTALNSAVFVATCGQITKGKVSSITNKFPNAKHIIGFDNDTAGRLFALKLAYWKAGGEFNPDGIDLDGIPFETQLMSVGIDSKSLRLFRQIPPDGRKDWNDVLKFNAQAQMSEQTESIDNSVGRSMPDTPPEDDQKENEETVIKTATTRSL